MIKPPSCRPCFLYSKSNSFSKPYGTCKNGVLVCGEALGHEEAINGYPFNELAQAGSKLEQCFKLAGFQRKDFLLWNVIACQPYGNSLLQYGFQIELAKHHCYETYFKEIINEYKPRCILALGNTAFQYLTNTEHSVLVVRGFPFRFARSRNAGVNPLVVGSYHPSYIKRGKGYLTPLLVEDIRKSVQVAKGEAMICSEVMERVSRVQGNYSSSEESEGNLNEQETEEESSIPF